MTTKVKICGLTNYEDAENAVELGADFLGFIQYSESCRAIKFEKVVEIVEKLRVIKSNKNVQIVGVFVNQDLKSILEIAKKGIFDILQLHGNEDLNYINELKKADRKNQKNLKIWKVARVKDETDLAKVLDYKTVDGYLLDNFSKNLYGGTGESFDWRILDYCEKKNIAREKIILSGGIGLHNIIEALGKKLYALDINSMIELYPGKKDYEKMKTLFEIIKEKEGN